MQLTHLFKTNNTFFLILATLLISCSSKDSGHIPDNVLSKEKMATLLTDVHLLEAAMNLNISNEMQTANENREEIMRSVLKKNEVTKELYDESFHFYGEHPELLSEVYKLTLSNLSELQAKVANEKDTTIAAKDSLRLDSVKTGAKKIVKPGKKITPKP